MPAKTTLVIHGLAKSEVSQINSEKEFSFREEEIPDGAFGEPVTFALIATVTGITALAAFLLKKNKRKSFEQKIEIVRADGSKETRTIKYKESESVPDANIAEIVKQIQSFGPDLNA